MSHRLDPMLRPESIAVLGASEREDSVGLQTMANLLEGQYPGRLYAVNPGYDKVRGVRCFPTIKELPETVDHVIFTVGDARLEAALDEVIAHGARAVTIMSSLVLEEDKAPVLKDRIARKVQEAGLLVCGGNGMGFYNFRDRVWACGFDTRSHSDRGNVTLISHSGSGMAGIVDVDERIDFNLAVSTGQELTVTMADYMDFALDLPETRVIGLFMETARDPGSLMRVLEKANRLEIPVVAVKVGTTDLSAQLAVSHSGAIAGEDAAFDAVFRRFGVQRVRDMDELATALIMFAQPHPVGPGGLVSLHDSGGERQLLIDVAGQLGVSLTTIEQATRQRLEALLDPGLPAVNPLDAWGTGGADADELMARCLSALMADPGASVGAVVHDRAPQGHLYKEYLDYLRRGHAASGKPAFLVSNRQGTGSDDMVVACTREGFPVLDGLGAFLTGVRCLFGYRDFLSRDPSDVPAAPAGSADAWRPRLKPGRVLNEQAAGPLLESYGIQVNPCRMAADIPEALEAARGLGFPVVLKTAREDIAHKTEARGVVLDINDESELICAAESMASRHGPGFLISCMIRTPGVEMMLGQVTDKQFGPLVALGFGGINVESLGDVVYALPPFDAATAQDLLNGLKLRRLLDDRRDSGPLDRSAFCEMAARFSVLIDQLGDRIEESDINPIIIHSDGCVAVDALIVCRKDAGSDEDRRRIA